MRVWIDLSNSPHALLFAPVAARLEELGHEVLLTARDNAQTVELARQRWPSVEVIGGPSPGGRGSKLRSAAARARKLASWAREARPDVALSHNSYMQIAAARGLGVRTVTAMDYEHQPANHLAFRLADAILLPAVLADTSVRRMGARPAKVRLYDGLKEELYLGGFTPDPGILEKVGAKPTPGSALVVARTPPSGALYHRSGNPVFGEVLRRVCARANTRCVVLARRSEQRRELAGLGLPNLILPASAVDARSLLHAADLVVGAGGTMTREAALLGVPTASVFAGRTAAVDRLLQQRGMLTFVRSPEELPPVRPRSVPPRDPESLRARSDRLVGEFISAVLEPGEVGRPAPALVGARA